MSDNESKLSSIPVVEASKLPATIRENVFLKLPAALKAVAPKALNTWAPFLEKAMREFQFDNAHRVAAALGQMTVESMGFTTVTENLNYSASGLLKVFPKYFNQAQAAAYARHPEMIANHVYASRMGNGDEKSGDGWRRRGAGLIQMTGAKNQDAYAATIKLPQDTKIWDYLRTAQGATHSACWFLASVKLPALADQWMITRLSRAVNGGDNGLSDRMRFSNMALSVLQS